jgi:hypothetical protein
MTNSSMSAIGTTLAFKPGRMNGSLPSISANQASGCFVCFREVDHSLPVAEMGAKQQRPAESGLTALGEWNAEADIGIDFDERQFSTRSGRSEDPLSGGGVR